MGRTPCCDKSKVKKGAWSPEEDTALKNYLQTHGTSGNWIALPTKAGLNRCGKSCRLRWLNYLRPDIKRGRFTEGEDNVICTLYSSIGSRWSVIASHFPGRTDNDVKNYWNTKLKKNLRAETNKNVTTRNSSSSDLKATVNPKIESPRNHGSTSSCFDDILSYHRIDANFWGKSFEPCSHYSRLNPMEASGFGTSTETNSFGISSFQEVSNLPTSSSLVENNFTVWSGNYEGAHNSTGGFMDLGFESLPDDHVLLDGFSY